MLFARHKHATNISPCSFAPAEATKSDVVHFLSIADSDVELDSAVKAYQRAAYASKSKSVEKPEESLELSSKVQRKYIAAQIVESGIQVGVGGSGDQQSGREDACTHNQCSLSLSTHTLTSTRTPSV